MKKNSFTLIEMLVVIAIIGILAAMVIPVTGMARNKARLTDCTNNKGQLMKAMLVYAGDHKGAIIYRGLKGSSACTYATVLGGMNDTVKQYTTPEIMVCTMAKQKLNDDATNVSGMLNAINIDLSGSVSDTSSGSTSAWLNKDNKSGHKRYKTFGRFASSRNSMVIYDLDKFKASASSLLIFADTFKRGVGEPDPTWNFIPDAATGDGYYVTLIHGSATAGAFADGHAEGMEEGRLKDCATEVTKMNDADFNEVK